MKEVYSARVAAAAEVVRRFVPEFKVEPKSANKLHRVIGWILSKVGNPEYNSRFWTTLGYTAAYPDSLDESFTPSSWTVVLHEGMHALQRKRGSKMWMNVSYLLPQVLAVPWLLLCVLAVVLGFWSWWLLLGVVVLAPLPAWHRAQLELEAYQVSVAVDRTWWGGIPPKNLESYINGWLVRNFTGPHYYWMWPFKKTVWNWFVKDGQLKEIPETPYLTACKELAAKYHAEDFRT